MTAVAAAAHNLRVDHMTAEVLRAFEHDGVASVLLKGPSTVRWLYAGRPRQYEDCDLLVPPANLETAEHVLLRLGFRPELEQARMPAWWQEHANTWRDPERFANVDLHRTLKGAGVEADRVWGVLEEQMETMVVGGFPSMVLSVPGRLLTLALTSALDGVDKGDLGRAVELVTEGEWRDAARLAEDLEATTTFAAGLELVPEGRALARKMGLPEVSVVDLALRAGRAPSQALTVDRLARASSHRERVAIAARKLFPPPTYMRHWSRAARRGRAGLLLAYLHRLGWVARRAPRAALAWRRTRRALQGPPDDA